jgi:hypothetical protein
MYACSRCSDWCIGHHSLLLSNLVALSHIRFRCINFLFSPTYMSITLSVIPGYGVYVRRDLSFFYFFFFLDRYFFAASYDWERRAQHSTTQDSNRNSQAVRVTNSCTHTHTHIHIHACVHYALASCTLYTLSSKREPIQPGSACAASASASSASASACAIS